MTELDFEHDKSEFNLGTWTLVAFISLLLTSVLGVALRYAFVGGLPEWVQYRNLQHTHSHIGMMGWIYGALYIFIVRLFNLNRPVYRHLFWLTQCTVLGMLFSFPVQGYGAVSILFTSLHLLFSYLFIFQVFRDLPLKKDLPSQRMLKTSLILLFISTLGTWALGAIMNSSLKGTAWYYGAIQFFLHFQFNGWFIFAIVSLFFKYIENKSINIPAGYFKPMYWTLLVSCILTYLLAVTWSTPSPVLFLINSFGVIIQLAGLYFLFLILKRAMNDLRFRIKGRTLNLLTITFYLFVVKIVMQLLVALPSLAVISYTIRNFVIGFIHLLTLGVLSVFLFAMIHEYRSVSSKRELVAIRLFLVAFFATELLLFTQGLLLWGGLGFIPGYYILIFLISVLFPIAIALYLIDLNVARKNGTLQQ